MSESVIVQAVGVGSRCASGDRVLSRDVAEAMRRAVEVAQADGIVDPEEIRQRIMDARDRVRRARGLDTQ